jgi:hypothetical protein
VCDSGRRVPRLLSISRLTCEALERPQKLGPRFS